MTKYTKAFIRAELKKIAAEKSKDYVPEPLGVYADVEGEPVCIMGVLLNRIDSVLFKKIVAEHNTFRVRPALFHAGALAAFNGAAVEYMSAVQRTQDDGYSWSTSLELVELVGKIK